MQPVMLAAPEALQSLDQTLVQRVELVGALGQPARRHLVLEPGPLEDGGLEERGRRVGVVFEQLRRSGAVVGEVEAAVEIAVAPVPAVPQETQ